MPVNAFPLMLLTLVVLAIAYRYYSGFIAAKVLALDDRNITPAHRLGDGHNYHPTNKWVLFGHHFAAITGAGPLIGPVLAAQFGYAPGFIWILVGVCLAGAVHDFVILTASVRRDGKSLAKIAAMEAGPVAGVTAAIAIFFVCIVALAGLGSVVVNALADSIWGTFTIATSIPIALIMGLWMYKIRPGKIAEASAGGVIALLAMVIAGRWVAHADWGHAFLLSRQNIIIAMAIYGFIASVLPVWLLLCPRDYLSSYMKLGTIAFLVIGVLIVHPDLHIPAFNAAAIAGHGPIFPGTLFPFIFITIACGAISGFHALVGSGTTPKMIDKESQCRPIGYGAMLLEGLVGIVALIAAASLHWGDYLAINVPVAKFAALGVAPVNLVELSKQVGESLAGRTGGGVTLAVGMAQIFSGVPGLGGWMDVWYHFAIMFEALFVLTTIDTGTRVARYLVQEFAGVFHPKLAQTGWMPGTIGATALVVLGWGTLLWNNSISEIWPMFGVANQLLAVTALAVGTTLLVNEGKRGAALITALPLAFLSVTTLTAGWMNITVNFLPKFHAGIKPLFSMVNVCLTALMMICVSVVIVNAVLRCWRVFTGRAGIRRLDSSSNPEGPAVNGCC
jgi:carbon starvation protein